MANGPGVWGLGCHTYVVRFPRNGVHLRLLRNHPTFASAKDAFDEGWDVPPYFTGYVSCGLCPGSFIALGQTNRHNSIHERWEREGRPSSGPGRSGGVPSP